jgi:valyl-tRNA synthetase
MHELAKVYDPAAIEPRWAEHWVRANLFAVPTPAPGSPESGHVFTLLLPPPNVTGRLHMGHMLNQTEMDVIIRWRRMHGVLALWVPGTDHAGIATQMMVERQLASEGLDRRQLGREKFIERVWQWRAEYGGAILAQMKRLGASVDWSREYFTMDEGLSAAVREVFVRLYEDGLIYRGNYIINWCPRCLTAISDLEVVHEETQGKLFEIRYPVIGSKDAGAKEFITVATTRPETMLGDTAVAVHPNDARYQRLHGKRLHLPLAPDARKDVHGHQVGPEIPIILDELATPEFGTGAVKVTPAHDPNDFQAGLRHNLPQVNVMDEAARMNANAGAYVGLDRYDAREKVLEDLRAQNLLVAVKEHVLPLGKCARCSTIVEPRLSMQWFVAVNKQPGSAGPSLAARAKSVVQNGSIKFTPENYKSIYLQWMENIHDWCISRQLWWGHRIPAWHCRECKEIIVARSAPAKCSKCASARLEQETDVLDTWFSSALLPFTAFGWPKPTPDLDVFYPTSLLITGFDILFFWVARMIMMGSHFMKDHPQGNVPFREVYIHALVRDAERQKMSKTKGNVIDPIEVTEKYGTDAVRFTLAAMASPGTDIAFSESRTEGYQKFANKIWNAARFIFMNIDRAEAAAVWKLWDFQIKGAPSAQLPELDLSTLEDRWIASRFNRVAGSVNEALRSYRFHEAAHEVYQFFWGEFCDWYIEIIKLRLIAGQKSSPEEKTAARVAFTNVVTIFEASLRVLAPFMPFLTEELWYALYDGKPPLKSIAFANYPVARAASTDSAAESEMQALQTLVESVRNLRAELKVEPRERVFIKIHSSNGIDSVFERSRATIEKLASVESMEFTKEPLANAPASRSTASFDVAVIYERKIDVNAERERLQKELDRMEKERANAHAQLANERFLGKAPANVVEGLRRRSAELDVLIEKSRKALDGLRG